MKRAPIWRTETYERLLTWHGASPSEIESLRTEREPELEYVPPPIVKQKPVYSGPAIENLFYMRTERPTLSELTDALRADGFPEEYIHRARTNSVRRRAQIKKDEAKLEKVFGSLVGTKKTVKKAVKAVKKRMV